MKKKLALILVFTIALSGVCFAWENVTTITLYSGPGYDYSSELGTLSKDWYVEVVSIATDSYDNYWAHIKYANYGAYFYMAYTPLSTINIDRKFLSGLSVEGQGVEDLVAVYDVDVYYGPHNPNDWDNQYAKCPNRLSAGSWAELIDSYGNYYLVDYTGNDGMKHRGYVQISALAPKRMPADDYGIQNGTYNGYSSSGSYSSSYSSSTKAAYTNGIYQEYVYESSHLTNQWGDYRVERAFDNNINTDWVEGSKGKQLNDYVGCVWRTNDSSLTACGIVIKGGMQYKGYESWNRNQRPKNITVTINGWTYYFTMSDSMGEQNFYFNDYIKPDYNGRLDLRITITSVYRLTNEEGKSVSEYDVAINDVDLLCARAQ